MTSNVDGNLKIIVRFASAIPDLTLEISNAGETTIRELFKTIRSRIPDCRDKHLKLIFQGRLLSPLFTIERAVRGNWHYDPHKEDDESRKAFIHCIVGPQLSPNELAPEDIELSQLQRSGASEAEAEASHPTEMLRGFDRLREAGFTESEISSLRSQFHQARGTNLESLSEDAVREAEDDWIDNGAQTSSADEFDMSYETLLAGVMIGFFGGAIACYFLWQRTMFSLRMQLSILVGIICNFVYGVLHSYRW
ncbi:Golgi Dsc E3 ligase complex subunit Dsc3 [Schizosaccharomyces osmophilus]|uniref:Golgi Dsc E3 ligase complex subunit Dsc3 n=1 Tax=Schizosaccharomyces osmophilus TaxID=2545709 RepID=A0AAE9WCC0_9SCHI|nr:Golgi Dsc E3 ligase complex subunit Dsc3 [Schizosaccharomyces osmophilus]WBW73706.1 Golgi Dsc E3 ligase complex subunit Dsc3 [Schizosaccharomyces osmophilus]